MTDIAKEIAELADLTTSKLREIWRRLYRAEPPAKLSRDLLIRAAAYQIQESEHGGLSRPAPPISALPAQPFCRRRVSLRRLIGAMYDPT